jgi:hypothetical protein
MPMRSTTLSACSAGNLCAIAHARRTGNEAESGLQIEAIDFVDHAVDIIAEIGPLVLDLFVKCQHLFDRAQRSRQRIDGKPQRLRACSTSNASCREASDVSPQ